MNARILATAALAAVVLGSSGCTKVQEALAPEPEVVTIEATVAASGAAVTGKELAPGAPEGVPLWPGAEVTSSRASADAYEFTLVTTDTYEDVLAGLATGFEQAGWDVAEEEAASEEGTQAAGNRSAVLTVSGPTAAGILTVIEEPLGTVSLAYVLAPLE